MSALAPTQAATQSASGMPAGAMLKHRYLLVVPIPWSMDAAGQVWMDRLWWHDLRRHLAYIERLSVIAPCVPMGQPGEDDQIMVPAEEMRGLRMLSLPPAGSWKAFVTGLPGMLRRLWRAVGESDIVHSGVVGWPVPVGWFANVMAQLRGRKLVLVIESAFWRIAPGTPAGWRRRARAAATERLARYFVDHCDMAIFTQSAYRDTLLSNPRVISLINPASWIQPADIRADFEPDPAPDGRTLRFLCPSRLTADKGLPVLLEAMRRLDEAGRNYRIDILGSGALAEACRETIAGLRSLQGRFLEPVAYGAEFFGLLQGYDCILVPIVSDEQPRIVFDAYSQGCIVLASDTDGLRDHVVPARTGWLVKGGDSAALAGGIEHVVAQAASLPAMRREALDHARRCTHDFMHATRHTVLLKVFGTGEATAARPL